MRLRAILTMSLLSLLAIVVLALAGSGHAYWADGAVQNGNQEFAIDYSRGLACHGDPLGDNVTITDIASGASYSITVGLSPMSLELGGDGLLYVAVTQGQRIAIIDLDARSLVRTIDLGFAPWSVVKMDEDHLVVSGMVDGQLHLVDLGSGAEVFSIATGSKSIVKVDPTGSALLVSVQRTNGSEIIRYDVAGDVLSHNASCYWEGRVLNQMVMDWQNDTVYLALMGEQELRILCISDLQYLGSTEGVYGNTPVGMALSRDGRLLAVSTISGDYLPESGSQVMVFDLSTRSPFYWNWIYALPPLAFLPQDDGVLLAQPMTVVSFIPRIIVEYPSPGTPTYFTPRQIAFRAETMTLVSAEASLTIDGQPISLFGYNNGFSAELTTVLADGLHVLEARATSAFGTGSLTWNFTIDRSGATTPLPMVVPLTPLDGAILIANTTRVGFDLIYPDAPERPYLLYVMTLNGVELEMHQNSEHVYVGISTYACQMGENHVTVRLSYDGRWQWLNWTFLILSKPSL